MKILNKKGLLRWGILCLAYAGFLSCSDTEERPGKEIKGEGPIPITLRAEGTSDSSQLTCSLYIFNRAEGGNGYQLNQILSPAIGKETPLPLEEGELTDCDFRFLFVATPQERNEIELVTQTGQTVTEGTPWEDIVLAMTDAPLTADNYYGIEELSGSEILQAGKVEGHLNRLPGQILFNFYKAGPGGADDPVAVDSKRALSVFDRIYQVDITYTGYAWGVTFGAENRLEPVYKENEPLEQTYSFTLTPDLQVAIPQVENHLELYGSVQGGVRMPGACFLPADKKMHITMIFHYYDTMPVCEITGTASGHSHAKDCYTQKEVRLNLPVSSAEGLSVMPDYFTVNKAALPCDRVIDIKHSSGLDIQTSWNVSNSN